MTSLLFVDHSPRIGGATRVMLTALAALDRSRFAPVVACSPGPVAAAVEASGAPAVALELPTLSFAGGPYGQARAAARFTAAAWAIHRLCGERRPAAIYAHGLASALLSAPSAVLGRVPLVWHVHELYDARPRMRPFVAAAARASRAIVVVSEAAADRLARLGVPRERCVVAPNSVPVRLPGVTPAAAPQDPLLVVAVGALTPSKGHATLVEAMAAVVRAVPGARLEIAGEPLLRSDHAFVESLRARIVALGLADSIRLVGFQADVGGLLARAAVVAHPSTVEESFGLVPLEAMAAGRPVVASRSGAIPEVVADGETGLLVPPGEPGPLAEALVALLRDPARRAALGEAGRLAANRRFAPDRMLERINAAFAPVLGAPPFLARSGGV